MSSGGHRRSRPIVEPDAQSSKRETKDKLTCEVTIEEERGRKKTKTKPVRDLVVNAVEKADTKKNEDCPSDAANVGSTIAMPEKSKLESLLGRLRRRDTRNFFAEAVNGEEVKHYYDVIKEPMDFGTITRKLNEGCYKTLKEFQHDVFLISSNAMLFNASNTIYYRQARAIRELAKELFDYLKTNPENFEAEFSRRRKGSGHRDERSSDLEAERRRTYRPWTENESLVSAVYKSPNQLVLMEGCYSESDANEDESANAKEPEIGYINSLMRFAKDLGPTARMVARRKIEAPCLKLHGNLAAGGQSFTAGQKMDTQRTSISSGEKASTVNETMNIDDVVISSRGIGHQPCNNMMKSLDREFKGKIVQTASQGLDLVGTGNFKGCISDRTAGIQLGSSFCQTFPYGDGKSNLYDHEFRGKMVPTVSQGLNLVGSSNFKCHISDLSVQLDSSFPPTLPSRDGEFNLPDQWKSNDPHMLSFFKMMQDPTSMENRISMGPSPIEYYSKIQDFGPTRNNGGPSSSSQCWPSLQTLTGTGAGSSGSKPFGYVEGMEFDYLGHQREGLNQIQGMGSGEFPSFIGNLHDTGALLSDSGNPMQFGSQPRFDNCFQQQAGVVEPNLQGQAGPSNQQGWAVTSPFDHGQLVEGLNNYQQQGWALTPLDRPNMYNKKGFQIHTPDGQGELSFGGLPDNYCQQQGWNLTPPQAANMDDLIDFQRAHTLGLGESSIGGAAYTDNFQNQALVGDEQILQWPFGFGGLN